MVNALVLKKKKKSGLLICLIIDNANNFITVSLLPTVVYSFLNFLSSSGKRDQIDAYLCHVQTLHMQSDFVRELNIPISNFQTFLSTQIITLPIPYILSEDQKPSLYL